jgi:hypothetical protein
MRRRHADIVAATGAASAMSLISNDHGNYQRPWEAAMCRNIKTLFNFKPPATRMEVHDASLQFVRKLSGFATPSKANEAAFNKAVEDITASAQALIASLVTNAEPRDRDVEAAKARARSALRFTPKN